MDELLERLEFLRRVVVKAVQEIKLLMLAFDPTRKQEATDAERIRHLDHLGWLFQVNVIVDLEGQLFLVEGYLRVRSNLSVGEVRQFIERQSIADLDNGEPAD